MERIYSTVEDIIADEGFQAWYSNTDKAAGDSWKQKMAANAELAFLAAEARHLMDALHIKEQGIPAAQLMAAEQRLMKTIHSHSHAPQQPAPVVSLPRRNRTWWWAAAAVLIIATSGVWIWKQRAVAPSSLATTFGEIREQQLPDGSKVMLNANSEISYQDCWKEGTTREIWLKGEAFFHVAKTPSKDRFIVHTDQFDVVVTGTQFNVMNREGTTNVMLTEGSVILKTRQGKEIYMKPGDFVEINNELPQLKAAKEENVLAWKEKKLIFEKTPLSIAVQRIQEVYGVSIRLASKELGDKPISCFMPTDNLEVLLQSLEATTEFHVVHKNNEIIITE